jgi:uncharacterized protein
LAEPAGTVRELSVDAPALEFEDGIVQTRGITGHLRLTRTNRGLLVRGRLRTATAQTCSRCLKEIEWPVQIDLDEEALPLIDFQNGRPVELEEGEQDSLRLTDHHELDLEGEVRDAISLAEPIAPVCREDCPGLCIVCGGELAGGPHEHADDDIDPRLAELRRFAETSD